MGSGGGLSGVESQITTGHCIPRRCIRLHSKELSYPTLLLPTADPGQSSLHAGKIADESSSMSPAPALSTGVEANRMTVPHVATVTPHALKISKQLTRKLPLQIRKGLDRLTAGCKGAHLCGGPGRGRLLADCGQVPVLENASGLVSVLPSVRMPPSQPREDHLACKETSSPISCKAHCQ